jgi:hypothetical protein
VDQKEENSPATEPVKAARITRLHPAYAKFMSEGWVASDLEDVVAGPAVTSAFIRRATVICAISRYAFSFTGRRIQSSQ